MWYGALAKTMVNPIQWLLDKFVEKAEDRLVERWKELSKQQVNAELIRLDIQWSKNPDEAHPNFVKARFGIVENAEKLKEKRGA